MGMYNDKVMDHFMNPKNVGDMDNPDATGTVGSPVCGDIMEIYLRIKDNVITEAKFKTFGCGSAIATSSIATEILIGKTVEEALAIKNQEIVDELGGLPSAKIHCSVLTEQAIKSAIFDYATKNNLEFEGLKGFDPEYDVHEHEHGEDDEA